MASPEQRIDKAVLEFKKLRDEVKELREKNEELDRKFEFVKDQLSKKYSLIADLCKWFLDKANKEVNELTDKKKQG